GQLSRGEARPGAPSPRALRDRAHHAPGRPRRRRSREHRHARPRTGPDRPRLKASAGKDLRPGASMEVTPFWVDRYEGGTMTGNWRAIRHRTGGFLGLAA